MMKAIPSFLVASALLLGTACSSTNPDTTASTPAGTGASNASGAGTTSGTADAGTTTSGSAAGGGTATAGSSTSGSADMSGGAGSAGGGAGAGGTAAAADMTAFMGTFATMEDPVFLMTAASSNMLEIQAGQMAAQKATNAEVRKFAQMMVSHHTTANQQLKAVATPLGVTMPQAMMPVHQAMADRLMNKSGKNFDETYMDMMETAHKMDIAMFEVKSKKAATPSVQELATKTLPMLRSHHTMADELEDKVD